ncbi:MAG: DUF2304 domain-containing protein [bacterium]
MLPEQRPFAVATSLVLLAVIVYLIRKRKLREEYALLWIAVGAVILVLSVWYSLLEWLTALIGAVDPTSTLFIFSLLFLLIMSLHFSIINSRMKDQIKDLTQEIALLRYESSSSQKQQKEKND